MSCFGDNYGKHIHRRSGDCAKTEIQSGKLKPNGKSFFARYFMYAAVAVTAVLMMVMAEPVNVSAQTGEEQPIRVIVDGRVLVFDSDPVVINGRTMVPMRGIFEALGKEVNWNRETSTVRVNSVDNNWNMSMQLGQNHMTVNGDWIEIDQPAEAVNGRTKVPVRAIADATGARTQWDSAIRTVFITMGGNEQVVEPPVVEPPQQDETRWILETPEGQVFWVNIEYVKPAGVIFFAPGTPEHTQRIQIAREWESAPRPQFQREPAVRLDIRFPNENPRTVANPNRTIEAVIREHVRMAMNMPRPVGAWGSMTPQMQQLQQAWSDSLKIAIGEAARHDESIASFPISYEGVAGLMQSLGDIGTFTAEEGESRGFIMWGNREIRVATHVQEGGRTRALDIDEIVDTLIYEVFGRGLGVSRRQNVKTSDIVMGMPPPNRLNSSGWATYYGFYNRMGEIVGSENIFANAFEGREAYAEWFNEQVPELHPLFNWDHEQLYKVIEVSEAVLFDLNIHNRFAQQINSNPHQHFTNVMNMFYRATDQRLSQSQRDQAARDFNREMQRILDFHERQGIDLAQTMWWMDDNNIHIRDHDILFHHPEHGTQTRQWFEQRRIPLVECREVFAEMQAENEQR